MKKKIKLSYPAEDLPEQQTERAAHFLDIGQLIVVVGRHSPD